MRDAGLRDLARPVAPVWGATDPRVASGLLPYFVTVNRTLPADVYASVSR